MAWGAKPPTRVRLCAKAAGLLEATSSSHRLLWISTSPKRRRRQFVWAKRLRVHISGFATQEPGSMSLLSLKSIVEPFFSPHWRPSRTRARLTVAASHTLGVLPDRTSFNPRSSPSEGLALNTQDASAHGGPRRRTWIRRSLPRWQGRFRRQRRPRRPRRLR